jgi:hypothetical protein
MYVFRKHVCFMYVYTCSCLSKKRKEKPESSWRHTCRLLPQEAPGMLAKGKL